MAVDQLFYVRLVWDKFKINQVDLFWFYNCILVSNVRVKIFYVICFELFF
jgi:hypothetical protein